MTAPLKCKRFSNSIDPTTIPKSNKEIKQLLTCLEKDALSYLGSIESCDSFVYHFQKSILPRLEQNQLSEKFVDQIRRYASAELTKTTFVTSNLTKILEKTSEDIEWWLEKYSREAKLRRGEPEIPTPDDLIDTVKIAYGDFVHLSVLLSQMFFALEFSSRMLCAFGCYRFALKISKSEVIQHKEVWVQLKRLGQKKGWYDCETCIVKASCDFEINFSSLARVYAYAMKVRQIADYTTRLASLNIFKSGLLKPPFVYFSSLIKIVESNFLLAKKCLPEHHMRRAAAPFLIFEKERKRLYAPFSWDETELKQLTAKQPRDALAWYLLGKLYFKRNDTFEAIECMEKAKELNPKNPDVWHSLGVLYDVSARTLRDERKALRQLEKAKELDPDNVDILFEIATMYLAFGNSLQAVEILEKAKKLATSPERLCAINQALSEAYMKLGDPAKAKNCLERVKEFDSNFQTKMKEWLDGFLRERRKFKRYLIRKGKKF